MKSVAQAVQSAQACRKNLVRRLDSLRHGIGLFSQALRRQETKLRRGKRLVAFVSTRNANYRGNFFSRKKDLPRTHREKRGGCTFRVISTAVVALLFMSPWNAHARSECVWGMEKGWITARDGGTLYFAPGDGPACILEFGGERPPLPVEPSVSQSSGGGWNNEYVDGHGALIDRYEPFPAMGQDAWLRTLTYTNHSPEVQDITGATFRVHPVIPKEAAIWNPPWFWMLEIAPNKAICLSYRGTTDFYRIDVDALGRPSHHVDACWRLAPGETAVIGAQGIWLGDASNDGFRREAQRWFDTIGLQIAAGPDWLADAILYEASAGGHIDSRFSDVGGFDRFARQADYLADLGISALWLQGVARHKTPGRADQSGWNLYDPIDFDHVDSILGGPDALKRLTAAFRANEIHVLGELVPHGGRSVQATALEPWWTYRRDGSPQRNWGGYGMDYSSPEWQAVMARHAAMLARDFGMEGARIDCADGSGPNWRAPGRNHASYSTLAGSVEMLKAIRDGFREGNPDLREPLIIPENMNTLEHFAVSPIAYGHRSAMTFAHDIAEMTDNPAGMAERLRAFFERERGAYPAGARVLRTLNNHDTVCDSGRVQYRYGAGLARALYGVCLMVPGLPMMYQEEEIGSFDALRAMNWARRRVPEFGRGDVDYAAVRFAPCVFACLRTHEGRRAIGMSNLAGYRVEGIVRVPIEDDVELHDAVSGRTATVRAGAFRWRMEAYETALIRVGQRPESIAPSPRYHGETPSIEAESLPLRIDATDRGWRVRSGEIIADWRAGTGSWRETSPLKWESEFGRIEFRETTDGIRVICSMNAYQTPPVCECVIYNARKWRVSGRTALLSDFTIRRHFPFPAETGYMWDRTMPWISTDLYNHIAPTGRLWQSVLEPLHPLNPALAFDDGGGRALVVSEISTNASNIVLTDRAGEDCEEPYGLALRFHVSDPELSPRISTFGLRQPWTMGEYPARSNEPLRVEMTLSATTCDDAARILKAERAPVQRGAAVRMEAADGKLGRDGIWLPNPGTITWSNLAAVHGMYRIRFELRHSESSADGTDLDNAYEVQLNGTPLPLEWIDRNVYQTGNAYFGYVRTPPVDLDKSPLTLTIKTKKPWCAIRPGFSLE